MAESIDAPASTGGKRSNFIVRFWRGEYSLGISYWAFGFGGQIATLALVFCAAFVAAMLGANERLGVIIASLVVVAFLVWWSGGVLRAADNHIAQTGRRGWAMAAKVMVFVSWLSNISEFVNLLGHAGGR